MANREIIDKFDFHIQDFQEGFNILLSSRNKGEFEANYSRILKGNLLVKSVNLFYYSIDDDWKQVYPTSVDTIEFLFPVSENIKLLKNFPKESNHTAIIPFESKEIYAVVVSEKFDGTDFSEEDILSFKLFSQLISYGYQSFKMIKKEKVLNFALKNKVMQLNTLIDTGIELTRLDNISQLISL